ncbi:GNAT family N-acetyltransferase [Streptomyces bacillaris]|uniref:GNAT family N-acetyltransferase n=1 Tax=Streptomyces bacillaris TaxID=68179 RepID=UPI0035E1EA74
MSVPPERGREPFAASELTVVPANRASWDDIATVLGTTDAGRCQCQRFKVAGYIWRDTTRQERADALREQTACGRPDATATSGLLAYAGGEPVGWVAVQPRTAYPKLRTSRVVWAGRDEDRDDPGVWAVTCFAVRKGFRGRGLTYPLAAAAVSFAEESGARALEAYPMVTVPGRQITWGELHVGAHQVFEEAGLREVSSPTIRRRVMRIDF